MAQARSKNARTSINKQKFFCSCGGEIQVKQLSQSGKKKIIAECGNCKRVERRPSDFN
ncbi:MAG: hypothetical protein LBK25_02580 [Treponema sp.]|jgi:hypothetical protein|nr:hypothetical protein [Treponema sp.]